ncbi:MAG TPA: biotin--[acetyl-CoA-carboxylase] ligase [Bacteroidales bacterium]|nr:biotin--[acetyl-CoA-carboxylase] ligase [Bacteroidales bacterium]
MDLPIFKMDKAASSNNEAMLLAKQKEIPEGTIVWVLNQTKGRGQGNKKWHSNPNENLTFSVLLKPSFLPMEKQFVLSKMVAVAVAKVVSCFCSDTFIKWPNDIYVKNNKIAGILIENSIQGQKMYHSVIGIGININQENFPSDVPNPTSLCVETGQKYRLEPLIRLFQQSILDEYEKLKKNHYQQIESYYDNLLYKKNQTVRIRHKNKEISAFVLKVDTSGFIHLLIENKEVLYAVGEIEFLIEKTNEKDA